MTTPNKQAITTFLDALGAGDPDRMATVLAPGMEACAKGTGSFSMTRSREQVLEGAGMLSAVLPGGIAFTVLTLTEEGDRVVAEVEGKAATADGTRYDNGYAFVATMQDGLIARLDEYYCTLLTENVLVPVAAGLAAQ
ncbi:nuclear transport factor 2 family protein [Croceicoccus mobilis]|uniref:SnoaL-like domain-containing protein n=1 Tax=Croceicoccus mobilis TaxID=1703339 RepID=A0A916Z7K5_9SPHN|nr:nuclear transport factor 2 family protein [Croceicoccus mobilis]GGD80065.1 hypothetical protein GCM10010990_32490 [Croceicoccus mobilis]